MEALPRDVPEGLTAPDYYRLAHQYKRVGWIEQARDSSNLASELGAETDIGKAARLFLKTKLPKYPVPLLAEQLYIEGFNQLATGYIDESKAIFEELIKDYPDFEWGYGQLAVLYIQEGDNGKARELLKIALDINPDYVNGWLHMAQADGLELDFEGAKYCVGMALKSDPTDELAIALKQELAKLDE